MGAIKLSTIKQTSEDKQRLEMFEQLVGIDEQKNKLLTHLEWIMRPLNTSNWLKVHHPDGLELACRIKKVPRLIILSGDVGCGKTELSNCVGTKLSQLLEDEPVFVHRAPSDLRGSGLVGDLANRMTAMFESVKSESTRGDYHILIIDEADDVSSSREGEEQHHEDRTGVNALIKEIDKLGDVSARIVVIMISNRTNSFDPAIMRRSAIEIKFHRPSKSELADILESLCSGLKLDEKELQTLVNVCVNKSPRFTYSDLFNRIALPVLLNAIRNDVPFSYDKLKEAMENSEPSPQFKDHGKN